MHNEAPCLVTDLDGTFVGQREGLQALLDYFAAMATHPKLIYTTGRHLDSALSLIKEENLPLPWLLATDIGTSLYRLQDCDWVQDPLWAAQTQQNWEPAIILRIAAEIPDLTLQALPDRRRVSFYAANLATVKSFENALKTAGIAHKLIYSSDRDLDILPENAGKASVLEYMIKAYRLNTDHLLVAGDSGNDRDMLALGYHSVIVGNGHQALIDSLEDHTAIYKATAHCAGGILEAWQHFFPQQLTAQKQASAGNNPC